MFSLIPFAAGDYRYCNIRNEACSCYDLINGQSEEIFAILCGTFGNYSDFPRAEIYEQTQTTNNKLIKLTMNNKLIEKIPSRAFEGYFLFFLDLMRNRIQEIEADAFYGQSKMDIILLDGNFIKILHPGSFSGLSTLYSLSMRCQMLQEINEEVFIGLDSLEVLDLEFNQITSLYSRSFYGLGKLNTLKFKSNKVREIKPYTFEGMNSLITLNLTYYGIYTLETRAFYGLWSLEFLDLTSNLMSSVQNFTFYGLTSLRSLSLRSNKIKSVDYHAFDGLNSLFYLYLSDNKLTKLFSYFIKDSKSLGYLDLSLNVITEIESNAFYGADRSLLSLDLSQNKLELIESYVFANMTSLKVLNLKSNLISTIKPHSFKSLTNLTELNLNDNCIFQLGESLFDYMARLNTIDLGLNYIQRFSYRIFLKLVNIEAFKFSENLITSLTLNESILPNLTTLDLSSGHVLSKLKLSTTRLISLRMDNCDTELNLASTDYNSLKILSLRSFTKLSKTNFSLLKNLEELDLSSNDLSNMSYFFSSVKYTSLKRLYIQNSTLSFELSLLANFPNLVELDLGWSRFNKTFKVSSNLKTLEKLKLNNLDIDTAFVIKYFNFFNLNIKKVSHLDLSNNRIDLFPGAKTCGCCRTLQYLDLKNNRIKSINMDLFIDGSLFRLNYLDLSSNELNTLQITLNNVPYLRVMDTIILSNNNNFSWSSLNYLFLAKIISSLYMMDLTSSNLGQEQIYNYGVMDFQLYYLNMSCNHINFFPNTFMIYTANDLRLIDLNLSQNNITYIEGDALKRLFTLRYLNLSHNQLLELQSDLFVSLISLKSLDLSYNLIEELNETLFFDMVFLEFMSISSNRLTLLETLLFSRLVNLIELDLSNNSISSIHRDLFLNLANLQILHLNLNPLFQIEPLNGLASITSIYVSALLLECDSNVQSLVKSITPRLTRSTVSSKFTVNFYKAVFVSSSGDNDQQSVNYKNLCNYTIYLAKNLILLNLRIDTELNWFLSKCQGFATMLYSYL